MTGCGIGAIINNISNRRFIFKSTDLELRRDSYIVQLENNCHFNQELQKDWNELGSENFSFETREITLNDDEELKRRFIHHINICSDIYNVFDSKILFKEELSSKIEILSYRLYSKTGKDEFSTNFKSQLEELKLDKDDGEEFVLKMLDKIRSDEINFYNYDSKFDELLSEISLNKKNDIEREKKENLLLYLYSVIGEKSHSSIYEKMLEDHNLGSDVGFSIRLELEGMINSNEIKSNFETDEMLQKILKREQNLKLRSENDRNMALNKLYSITGDYVVKVTFLSKLKSMGLSYEDGNLIKKDIERKIELNEINFAQVEFEVEKQLENKVRMMQNERQSKKDNLLSEMYRIIGNDSINPEFKDRLEMHDLHENIAFQIKNSITNQIEKGSLNDSNEMHSRIENLILKKEKDDVEVRLNDLSKNELDDIMKMNSLTSSIPFKAAKVAKLVNVVPLNIIKDNLQTLGHEIDVSFADNPDVIFCSNCGFKNSSDSLFCCECGYKLDE